MELFKDSRFDFLGRKWWFILPSLLLTAAGILSLLSKGGPKYGVDFLGGAVMDVKWEGTPPVEQIRSVLSTQLSHVSVVVAHDALGSNELFVSAAPPAMGDLMQVRQTIVATLSSISTHYAVRSFEAVGPQISADLRLQALIATASAAVGMLLFLAWRFRFSYGVAAVIAMLHDAVITIGLFSLLNQEISLTVVAALLTLIGYSMNDTIVVFDRIRENRRPAKSEPFSETVNRSINQTLSRTILTSGLTLLTAIALFFFGGPVLHGFSLALVIGIVVGTFSSVFIASPILLACEKTVPVGGGR